jgi:predicted ATPase/DNA-binding CsgD family transcriptional regulator
LVVTANALPAPATALVGRATELAALIEALTAMGNRLVTVTGPPGVGKTRLALAAAVAVGEQFPGGTVWVDLAPIRQTRYVIPEILRALGTDGSASEPALTRIAAAADRDLLLVLDNCEHLLDGVAEIGALLTSSPRLHILATSRERLQLAAEREFALPPLPMPTEVDVADLPRLSSNPSIALLLARAPAHVTLTARTARSLADVCVRLDGLPLAIELAAARLRVFTPSELAFRLDHRMVVLTGGSRDAPGRHRDLRGAIAWSHDLLPEAEQVVFRRLSVFVGEWTIEAAEAICGDPTANAVGDSVESLLDKSLIRRVAEEDGEARFSLLVSLREFAAEQLSAHGEVAEITDRHVRYFAAATRRWESTVGTNEETATWPRLGFVQGDLLAAFAASRDGGDIDEMLWLATGLGWYWYTRGSFAEAAALIEVVSAAAADVESSAEARAAASLAAGIAAFGLGDLDAAEAHLLRSAVLCEARDDERRLAVISAFSGHVARERGWPTNAAEGYAKARAIYQRDGNVRGTAWSAYDLGLLANQLGDRADAESLLREALDTFRMLEYQWAVAVTACALASVLLSGGFVDETARLLGEALVLHDTVGDRRGIAQCFELLADVAFTRRSANTAARLLGAAEAQRNTVAARPTEAEQARISRLGRAVTRNLGRLAADHQRHAGRTMPGVAAIAFAAAVTAGAAPIEEPTGAGGPAVELTPRQLEVAALVAAGKTNRQIGRALGISEKTAEIHLRNIMDRLQASSRARVAAWASARGLQPPP